MERKRFTDLQKSNAEKTSGSTERRSFTSLTYVGKESAPAPSVTPVSRETPKPQNGYVSVADLNRETNGSGVQTSDAILRQAAAESVRTAAAQIGTDIGVTPTFRNPLALGGANKAAQQQRKATEAALAVERADELDKLNVPSESRQYDILAPFRGYVDTEPKPEPEQTYKPVSRAIEESNAAIRYKRAQERVTADRHSVGDIYSNDFAAREADAARRAQNEAELVEATKALERLGMDSVVDPTGGERFKRTLEGGAQVVAKGYAGAGRWLNNVWAGMANKLADATSGFSDPTLSEGFRTFGQGLQDEATRYGNVARKLNARAEENVARAKQGAGGITRALVDVGTSGVGMASDAALGAATGLSGLVGMGVRVFGGTANDLMDAEHNMKTVTAAAAADAAKEVVSELMFDGLAGIYGGGAADEIIEDVINNLTGNETGRALLSGAADVAGESIEEIFADVVDPLVKSIYNGKSIGQNYSELEAEQILYDGLIGGLSALLTTSGQAAINAAFSSDAPAPLPSSDRPFYADQELLRDILQAAAQQGQQTPIVTQENGVTADAPAAPVQVQDIVRQFEAATADATQEPTDEIAPEPTADVSVTPTDTSAPAEPIPKAAETVAATPAVDAETEAILRAAAEEAQQETQPTAPSTPPQFAQDATEQARRDNLTPVTSEAAEALETPLNKRNLSDEQITAELRNAAKLSSTLGRNGAAAFMTAYNVDAADTISAEDAFGGFAKVYNAALNGKTIPDANIPDTLRIAAESSGKRDAQEAAQKKFFGEDAGLSPNRSMRPRNLSARDARILDAIGKATGVQIKFADHIGGVDERGTFSANAKIENGVLTIARDANDPIKAAFTHETIHRLRETAPEAYTAMARFVLENMSDERFDSALREHMKRYGSENVSDMTEETVADAFGTVLDNPDLLERAVGIDRTFGQKLLDAVQEIVAKIKRALGASEAQLTPEQVEAFRELQGKAEDMARLLGDALDKVQSANRENVDAPDETRYSRKIDSDYMSAVERGDMDEAQRMVDEAAEDAGYTVKAYHGTPNGTFNVFRDWSYFTENPDYADVYQNQGASSNGYKQTADKPKTYSVYLDPRNVFDTRKPAEREIFQNEFYQKWGNGAPLSERGLPDWTDGDDLIEFFDENGYDYDAFYLDEGGTGGYGDEVKDRGVSLIVKDSSQIKSADPVTYDDKGNVIPLSERFNEKKPDVRFSLKKPVEETDRFIALHNMSAEAMRGALELGGMAMPSVAMVPSTTGHDTYGEISAVFRKESVSPTDRRNKIFSGDAYTPTFPEVGLKISERAADNADRKVEALLKQAGVRDDYSPSLDTDNLRDQIKRFGSFEKAYGDKTYMKLAFLTDTGRKLTIPMREKVYTDRADIATLRKVAQEIDLDAPYGEEGVMKYEPIIRRLVREYAVKKYGEKIADKLRPADKALNFNDVDSVIHAAKEYQWRKTEKQVDKAALEKRIENAMKTKAVRAEYSAWLNEMGKDMVEKRGIRNNRDYFTPSGNRRSFEQLYYDYSLANIVRAMQEEVQQGKKTFLTGSGNIRGAAAKSYGSIEEARKDIGRIRNMAQEEVLDEKIQAFDDKCRDLCIRMVEGRGHNKFGGAIDAAEVLTETLAKYKTADQIYRYWQREYRGSDYYDMSREIAEEAAELVKEAQNLPTSYLEAKLYRAVPLDEPIAYVVPRNMDKALIQQMKDAGLNVITYKQGDSADRLKKINSVEGARFSRRRESGADQSEARLMHENDRLREQIAYWKAQTKRTPEESVGKVSEKDVRKVAAALVDAYGSTVSATDIAPELQSLYDLMGTGRNENGELSYDAAREIANSVALKIAENAIDDTESAYGNYADLRKFMRETPITVSRGDTAEVDDWGDWRKRNMGRMNVRRGDTSNIDVIYDELSDRWPEFFPGDVISVGEQLNRMADVMETIYNDRGHNPFDPYMDQAIIDIGNDVMERFFDIPQAKTFADRMIERQKRAASEKKEAVARAFLAGQMSQGAKMAEQMRTREARQEERLRRVRETLQKSIARRDERLERQAARFRAKTEEGREKQSAARLRKMITRHTAELSRRLLTPTDKKHIPDALRSPVAAMLEAINKESAYETVYGADGKYHRVKAGSDRFGEVTKRTQAFRALKEQYANAQKESNGNLVIDPDLLGDESEGFQGLFDRVIAMSDTPIQSMNTEQLETVWRVVRAVEHSIRNYGKTLAATKYKTTEDWARRFFSDTQKRRERSSSIAANLALDLENPYTFFAQFGQSGKDIYRMLRNAQDRQRVMLDEIGRDVKDLVDEKTVDRWRRERHDITTERGENLTLTTAQLMEIYNLSKREQAQDHLMRGGIVQPEIKRDGKMPKIERGADVVRLTAGDLDQLADMLTQEQREVADGLQRLTADKLAAWGNEASNKAYGYSKFTERNYWPIHSAKEALHSNVEKNSGNVRSIKNIGMAKAVVPHASNGLTIGDVFDTFAEHTADMVDYATWLLPMEDASRLYNFKYKGEDKDTFFKQQLDRVGGRNGKAQRYWENLMANIQNGIYRGGRTDFERLASGAVGKVKGASVGANVRVIVQQPTAFLRANAVMNPASLTRGIIGGVTRGNGWQKALQYAPIARIKDVGGFDQGNMRSVNAELFGDTGALTKINELAGKGAQAADAVTWGRLWNAAEWETKRLDPDIEAESAEFYRKTAELFTDVIDQSQVVDGVLQRSAVMRSSDGLTQQATSFMGEPLMALNMLMRSLDAVRYETDQKRRSAAIKQFGRVVVALAVTDIVNSAVQSLVDAYRDDDRDKDYWERFAEKLTGIVGDEQSAGDVLKNVYFGGNLAENMSIVRRIPYAKDVVSMWQGFNVKRMDTQAVNDLVTAIKQLNSKKWSAGYGTARVAEQVAKIVGIPAAAIERDALGAARSIVYATDDPVAIYKFDKAIYNPATNKSRFYQSLYLSLEQGNVEDYAYLRDDLTASGMTSKTIDDAMKSLYSKKVKANDAYTIPQGSADLLGIRQKYSNGQEDAEKKFSSDSLPATDYTRYTNQRAASYKEYRDALTSTPEFKALTDKDKDRAISWAYSLANDYALEANAGGEYRVTTKWETYAKDAERYGIDVGKYLLFHVVYETSGTDYEGGKAIKGQSKSDKVHAWLDKRRDLTSGQKEWLWSTVYTSGF